MGRSAWEYNGEFILQLDGSGNLYVWDFNNGYGFNTGVSAKVTTGQRTHVAFVKSGTQGTFYVNGVSVGQITATSDKSYVNGPIIIGGNSRDGNSYFSGTMDNINVYGAALADSQIYTLYMRGKSG